MTTTPNPAVEAMKQRAAARMKAAERLDSLARTETDGLVQAMLREGVRRMLEEELQFHRLAAQLANEAQRQGGAA